MPNPATTVGASTYDVLKRDIIFGQLAAGSKLKLDALRVRCGVSVSTLREALNRLASEGFVRAEVQRGFFVAPISKEDLIEVAELRILLEGHALKASIQHGDVEWEGRVVAAHHKLSMTERKLLGGDHTEMEAWKRYDSEFHYALISACQSNNLLSLHAMILDRYLRYQMQVLDFRGLDAVREHKNLMDAALMRDQDRAQCVLEDHIRSGLEPSTAAL